LKTIRGRYKEQSSDRNFKSDNGSGVNDKEPIILLDENERKPYDQEKRLISEILDKRGSFDDASSLDNNSVALALFDPQYEKSGDVSRVKD
jgi:hypothetical protein